MSRKYAWFGSARDKTYLYGVHHFNSLMDEHGELTALCVVLSDKRPGVNETWSGTDEAVVSSTGLVDTIRLTTRMTRWNRMTEMTNVRTNQ